MVSRGELNQSNPGVCKGASREKFKPLLFY